MNKENTKKLFEEFNYMFRGRHLPITENLMPFGFECGDGWFDLIRELCQNIIKLDPSKYFIVEQVKEKFGGLRFYVYGSTNEIEDLIEYAEAKSLITCEICGKTGKERGNGWIRTLCDECENKRNNSPDP